MATRFYTLTWKFSYYTASFRHGFCVTFSDTSASSGFHFQVFGEDFEMSASVGAFYNLHPVFVDGFIPNSFLPVQFCKTNCLGDDYRLGWSRLNEYGTLLKPRWTRASTRIPELGGRGIARASVRNDSCMEFCPPDLNISPSGHGRVNSPCLNMLL